MIATLCAHGSRLVSADFGRIFEVPAPVSSHRSRECLRTVFPSSEMSMVQLPSTNGCEVFAQRKGYKP